MKNLFFAVGLILLNFSSFSQLKVLSTGRVQVGGNFANSGATINLYADDGVTLRSDANFSFGWGEAIKSYVNRADAIAFSSWFDGNRTFAVFGNGNVWSNTGVFYSDSILKYNINNIQDPILKLKQLRGITYNSKLDDKNEKKMHSGFVAQEIEKIFPDMVYLNDKGEKGVAYIELIPYLIEALKIQQTIIEEQNNRLSYIELNCCYKPKSAEINVNDLGNSTIDAKLYQNIPNPFNMQSTIYFEIPESVNKAQIYLCNMTSTLLKSFSVIQRNRGSIVVDGYEFNAGMYLYSLVCDGGIVDTKQMILTK